MAVSRGVSLVVKRNQLPALKVAMKSFAPKHNKMTGFAIEHRAKKHAPVDTGFLRNNIFTEDQAGGMVVLVHARARYSGYQEFGTRYQQGTKFMRPAVEETTDYFINGWRTFFARFGGL